ncbi:MAG: thioredoxin domain-containing protein [Acidimicrobiia bacterium]
MNRLASESSPYLRQHADNPVHWFPWGEEARAEAERRDVPILLSIGYSACHWCHVMAHESFEDEATAAVMNEHFVNVKVDREERPDVDAIYMEAVQAMTGRGGWPMTVFLAPDGRPFYGGTYFPPQPRGGMPSFTELLEAVHDTWTHRRDDLFEQADRLTEALGQGARLEAGDAVPGVEVLTEAINVLHHAHDDEWGGFGQAPKFPTPQNPDLVLRGLLRTGEPELARIAEATLDAMASGGMYDHLGGGFARYSVDRYWVVPHFEKMLYDQSGLVRLYLHGFQVLGHDRYRQVVEETVGYVLRDLRQPGGGIASAEDADSLDPATGHSEEGAFSVFTPDEVRSILVDAGLGDVVDEALAHWELDRPANFEGRWIPVRTHHRGDWERPEPIERARQALFEARSRRPRPGLDDKVLTEWNAHWVAALAEAGAALDRADWVEAAEETARFLQRELRRDDGRWLRAWQADTGAKHLAFAADHAALVDAFTRLSEATGRASWIVEARAVADAMLELFWDEEQGGLFTTGIDGEQLVTRDKDLQDGAVPSANSTAAVGLLRLAALTGEDRYRERAEAILRLSGRLAVQAPTAFGVLLAALDLHHSGATEVVVAGDRPDLVDVVRRRWLPTAVLAWGERFDSPLWEGRDDGRAYVCRHYACGLPATTPEELAAQLPG